MTKVEYKKENKICQNCKNYFPIESEDFSFYEKIKMPPPTFCSECRLQRRMATFNVRSLYNRKCDNCHKKIVSIYRADAPYTVWCLECYFSDKFNPLDYSLEYDFSLDFFTQFEKLKRKVPQLCIEQANSNGEKCEYANYTYSSSDIYLSYNVTTSEHVYYSTFVNKNNKNCFDSLIFKGNELCYEIVDSNDNYECSYLTKCHQCIDSKFLFNCVNCQNCFMSSNQRNRNYVFRNRQLSKETYKEALEKEKFSFRSSLEKLIDEYKKLMISTIVPFATLVNTQNCTGNFIENSKNCLSSFYVWNSENNKYITYSVNASKDSYDMLDSGRGERMYESICSGKGNYEIGFASCSWNTMQSYYCHSCNNVKNNFGCIGLDSVNNCILNKQYTEKEYEVLIEKIKKQMETMPYIDKNGCKYKFGEFFPIELSSFCYNETMAYEQFPLSKEQILKKSYQCLDDVTRNYKFTIESADVPTNILDVSENILEETIHCEHKGLCSHQCTNAFRIMPDELKFYKRMKLPIPSLCPNCRYFVRLERTLPWKLWHRKCMNKGCSNEFETSYAPDRSEKVYCKKCYQQEVY